jgi:hypothetical protein
MSETEGYRVSKHSLVAPLVVIASILDHTTQSRLVTRGDHRRATQRNATH